MFRIFSLCAVLLFSSLSLSARTYVLSIGVSRYQNEANNLGQTTKDAKNFRDVMLKQTKDVTTLTSKYANRSNILEKLKALCNRAQKGDKIIVYFSGHGYPGGIATYDQGIQYTELNDMFDDSAASAIITIVDACHSGSANDQANPGGSYDSPSGKNILYIMACRADEYSYENYMLGHGAFTQGILKGLRGKADANKDKKVTVKELFNYAYKDVQRTGASNGAVQHPQLIGSKNVAETVIADWSK